ncbi:MAG: AlpA family phage regulatory protein [Candidatus Competibacteraceae bacterium]|nr:AlpA family phage regulatory protein [Candidatus Competibacteraceae bacterium]
MLRSNSIVSLREVTLCSCKLTKDRVLFTGISLPTAYRLARQNRFPKPRKLGLRASGWLRAELEAFARGEWQPKQQP